MYLIFLFYTGKNDFANAVAPASANVSTPAFAPLTRISFAVLDTDCCEGLIHLMKHHCLYLFLSSFLATLPFSAAIVGRSFNPSIFPFVSTFQHILLNNLFLSDFFLCLLLLVLMFRLPVRV